MGMAAIAFARDEPDDARLLLSLRPADLVDGAPDAAFGGTLAAMNAPLATRVSQLAERLYDTADARAIDAVTRAVVDLPYAVVRRHAADRRMPRWLAADVAAAIRALLVAGRRA
jgi:hypothetical protein